MDVTNVVVVSDLHCGCRLSLCPPHGAAVDDGGTHMPSTLQRAIWAHWESFWNEFVPSVVKGEPYAVVTNGDVVEGVHHGSTTQISHNLGDQARLAYDVLAPVVDKAKGGFYMVRGTEAHVSASAREEETLAERLGAIPNAEGQHARWDLWARIGPHLVHFLHHISSTGSQSYEATAVHKELIEEFVEAARWRREPPAAIVRSHRHRHIETTVSTGTDSGRIGRAFAVVTPAWQGKTPFAWKIPGARLSTPQFGGIVLRYHDGVLFSRECVWTVGRSEEV